VDVLHRGGDVRVAHPRLDAGQVNARLNQPRAARVPETMRAHVPDTSTLTRRHNTQVGIAKRPIVIQEYVTDSAAVAQL
jgi:hypothetical protein